MTIICWNCQGLGSSLTIRSLKDLCFLKNPKIVCLIETKAKRSRAEIIKRSLQFDNMHVVDPIGLSGGFLILWRKDIQLNILESKRFLIDSLCNLNDSKGWWRLTFVYGSTNYHCRKALWSYIGTSQGSHPTPWLCMGDYNDILRDDEKEGNKIKAHYKIQNFQNFLNQAFLIELEQKGCQYTWSNNREGRDNVREKLDRSLMNWEWRLKYPNALGEALPAIGSDHCPILVTTTPLSKVIPRRFKFEAYWLEEEECEERVCTSWKVRQPGSAMFKLQAKLRESRRRLWEWNRQKFRRGGDEVSKLKQELKDIHNATHGDFNRAKHAELMTKINLVWEREEKHWGMRARLKWLQWGDRNSKFFHATTLQRRSRNSITRLKDTTDEWTDNPDSVKTILTEHFQKLFSSEGERNFIPVLNLISPKITEEMNRELLKPVDKEEIKKAAFELGANKAPGPDGFSGMFFQKFWNLFEEDIFIAFNSFFQSGFLLKALNLTNIVLVPKVKSPESASQFRPISLCNFIYKIFSKVLVNRMKPIMSNIVSPTQSAFIPGRQIQDNIIVAQEVFHHLKRRKKGNHFQMALKLDMNKAYDRVEWDFLEALLLKMGLSRKWVCLIIQCVSTVSYSLILNGEHMPPFRPQRGLRQGDPLSPYLFILLIDALSSLLTNAVEDRQIQGIKLSRSCPTLSHLLFADDSLFFSKATKKDSWALIQVLQSYCYASGQQINLNKSGLIFSSNTPVNLQNVISSITRIPILKEMGNYLGLPSHWGTSRKQIFKKIEEKFDSKIEGWKEKLLNGAGKEVLIKAVLQSIPSYSMTIFKLPNYFCKKRNSKLAKFWWSDGKHDKKIH